MPTPDALFSADGLQTEQREAIRSVLARYPQITSAVLYGSRAMGRYRPGSDIDLVLLGDIDLVLLNAISNALDDLLLPYAIDLSVLGHIDNEAFRQHIERVGKVFYATV